MSAKVRTGRTSPSPMSRKPNPTKPSTLKGAGASISKSNTVSSLNEPLAEQLAQTVVLQPALVAEEKEDVKKVDIRGKLEYLSTRFQGFEEELVLTKQKKKTDEDKKIVILQTQIDNLQSSLGLESKNRAIAMKALQSWLTDRIKQWTEQIEEPMKEKIAVLHNRIDDLHVRIDGLEKKQNDDREIFPKLVDARCEELLREIKELKIKVEQNHITHEEKEKRILLKVQDNQSKLQQQFIVDKNMTDNKIAQIRVDIEDEMNIRAKGHSLIKQMIADEIAILKSEMIKEKEIREAADEDLVQAVNHYSAALQDGVKIVSSQ